VKIKKKIIILENIKSNELSLVFSKIVSKGLCCDKVWRISTFPSCTPIRGIYRKSFSSQPATTLLAFDALLLSCFALQLVIQLGKLAKYV